jgi:hypothetical protein
MQSKASGGGKTRAKKDRTSIRPLMKNGKKVGSTWREVKYEGQGRGKPKKKVVRYSHQHASGNKLGTTEVRRDHVRVDGNSVAYRDTEIRQYGQKYKYSGKGQKGRFRFREIAERDSREPSKKSARKAGKKMPMKSRVIDEYRSSIKIVHDAHHAKRQEYDYEARTGRRASGWGPDKLTAKERARSRRLAKRTSPLKSELPRLIPVKAHKRGTAKVKRYTRKRRSKK